MDQSKHRKLQCITLSQALEKEQAIIGGNDVLKVIITAKLIKESYTSTLTQ